MSERYGRLDDCAEPRSDLAALYRRHAGWLTGRLRRRFGPEAAEDLVQEAYLRVAAAGPAALRHPKAYLLRVAVNLGLDAGRRRARAQAVLLSAACDGVEPPAQMDGLLLREAVLSLPEPLKDVFVLSRFGHLTYEEIAERLGLSVKTVEWRMSRALAHCAARLRP